VCHVLSVTFCPLSPSQSTPWHCWALAGYLRNFLISWCKLQEPEALRAVVKGTGTLRHDFAVDGVCTAQVTLHVRNCLGGAASLSVEANAGPSTGFTEGVPYLPFACLLSLAQLPNLHISWVSTEVYIWRTGIAGLVILGRRSGDCYTCLA
jgi:hypothetical protein